ncbi:MAG: DUF4838 domain-containing protein [Planctomycetaceae bacterium]|nr:DUF4838 domain-containing protein [Planctomycetaceae bacterium]
MMRPATILMLLTLTNVLPAADELTLIENGTSRAEIVISQAPARMQRVAAETLRRDLEKISGVRLPIVTSPSSERLKVFVGESESCPITKSGLTDGAYRIVTGHDWIALVGDDTDFTPTTPFARNNGDIPRAQAEWESIIGAPYGLPSPGLYKNRLRLPGNTGKLDGAITEKNELLEIWGLDERGSFNAVCGLLRKLGARWYLPGELGEVLPSLSAVAFPMMNETVRPDFPLRQFNFRFSTCGYDTAMWAMRLGIRNDERLQIAHGMATMASRDAVFAAHPDWFAQYGGRRTFRPGSSKNQLCYSGEELFRETVRYARAQLDTYNLKTVSIMPPDGYTSICQCELCRGKDSPERNERGLLSDYVWDFVNRVAREIAKSHPDAKVLNCAYGVYTLPPESIDLLEPNVVVCIVGGRRPVNKGGVKGEGETAPEALRAAWANKTSHPILVFENYPFTDRGWYLPSFALHSIGSSINATKGVSQGEDIWLSIGQNFDTDGIGFNHFMVYFTARMYWGGPDADADAMFEEYCRLFYGPAEREMRDFFLYCETNWQRMENDQSAADTALQLFDAAKGRVTADSIYGRRLALIDDYLHGLRSKSEQLGQKRGPVPVVRLVGDAADIVVDGRLEDDYWQNCPVSATGRLRELQTGGVPVFGTTFQTGWAGHDLYFAIRCSEEPLPVPPHLSAAKEPSGPKEREAASSKGQPPAALNTLRNTATRNDDAAIWEGDVVEILLQTETHSYYQIAVSPSGAVTDLDRGALKGQWFGWNSNAEVATHIGDGYWTIEARIPVTDDENDPLHQVVGRKPTQSLPWHINICRQRIRDDGSEHSALSPTGGAAFHEPLKFAHFYAGRSHRFEADPHVTDFAIGYQQASQQHSPTAFLSLLDDSKNAGNSTRALTDFQKSAALEQAALLAKEDAAEIISRIPLPAVRKAAEMHQLLANGRAAELVAGFADDDLTAWPFWKRGVGYHLRGRAQYLLKQGAEAEHDLLSALRWTSESRKRDAILLTLALNREHNLHSDEDALPAFQSIVADRTRIGSSDEYSALQGIARIQTRRGNHTAALAALNRADPQQLTGTWKGNILLSIGDVQQAAGHSAEAELAFRTVLEDTSLPDLLRESAKQRLK